MSTRSITLFALILICTMPCMAKKIQGNGTIVTKEISIDDYSSITLGSNTIGNSDSWFSLFSRGQNTSYVFNYKQGTSASLLVTIDENLYPYLKIKTDNSELTISTKNGEQLVPTSFKINGTSKGLKKIHMSGKMDFVLQSALTGDNLEVIATSGSDIVMKQPVQMICCTITARSGSDIEIGNLTCKTIDCKASSGSDINLKGKAEEANYTASSGSDITSGQLIVNRLECKASSGSDISAHVTDYIQASASGGSDVHYKGNPKADTSTSGGSDIIKEGN